MPDYDALIAEIEDITDAYAVILRLQYKFGLVGAMFSTEDSIVVSDNDNCARPDASFYEDMARDSRWLEYSEQIMEYGANILPTITKTGNEYTTNWY